LSGIKFLGAFTYDKELDALFIRTCNLQKIADESAIIPIDIEETLVVCNFIQIKSPKTGKQRIYIKKEAPEPGVECSFSNSGYEKCTKVLFLK